MKLFPNDTRPLPSEQDVSPEIRALFERVRVARQAKIDRYRKPKSAIRQPYKDDYDDHD